MLRRVCVAALAAMIAAGGTGCGSSGSVTLPESQPPAAAAPAWDMVEVTGSVVNLRGGPGTEFTVLGQVVRGDSLQVTGGTEDWYRVYVPDLSLFAWIYSPLTTGTELP